MAMIRNQPIDVIEIDDDSEVEIIETKNQTPVRPAEPKKSANPSTKSRLIYLPPKQETPNQVPTTEPPRVKRLSVKPQLESHIEINPSNYTARPPAAKQPRTQPTPNEPSRNEPSRNEPNRNEPNRNEPNRNESNLNERSRDESTRSDSIVNNPSNSEVRQNEQRDDPVSRRGLPHSPEGATARYLDTYRGRFVGCAEEMVRLKKLAEAKIYLLRKKAPNFFETRLPTLINQAASNLLIHNNNTAQGQENFHKTHREFLRVLDELAKSQPAIGVEIDFQSECDRIRERDKLMQRHLFLHQQVSVLEATEIEFEDMGDDNPNSEYQKFIFRLEEGITELKKCSLMIAKIEGERIEEEVKFELKVTPRSTLSKLTMDERKKLEDSILEMLRRNCKRKWSTMIDVTIMEEHIEKLKIEPERFKTLVEKRELIKDALDSFTSYFREIDNQRREIFHENLLSDPFLRPKEGLILAGPNDLPLDVLERMEMEDKNYQRKIDDVTEEYSNRHCPEAESDKGEIIYDEADDNNIDPTIQVVEEYVSNHSRLFKDRVKEEPRDDYEFEYPSEDETSELPEIFTSQVEKSIECYNRPRPTPRTP